MAKYPTVQKSTIRDRCRLMGMECEIFEGIDFAHTAPTESEYQDCTFQNCNLSGIDLSGIRFIDCEFIDCNLSLAKMIDTVWRDVIFKNCKMLGMGFDVSNRFGLAFSFDGCTLDHSSFHNTKIKNTLFKNTHLKEVDFSQADLTGVIFDNCDLKNAAFDQTIIEKADFRTAVNYSIDPDNNKIKKAKFSILGLTGLLEKYNIEIEK